MSGCNFKTFRPYIFLAYIVSNLNSIQFNSHFNNNNNKRWCMNRDCWMLKNDNNDDENYEIQLIDGKKLATKYSPPFRINRFI